MTLLRRHFRHYASAATRSFRHYAHTTLMKYHLLRAPFTPPLLYAITYVNIIIINIITEYIISRLLCFARKTGYVIRSFITRVIRALSLLSLNTLETLSAAKCLCHCCYATSYALGYMNINIINIITEYIHVIGIIVIELAIGYHWSQVLVG